MLLVLQGCVSAPPDADPLGEGPIAPTVEPYTDTAAGPAVGALELPYLWSDVPIVVGAGPSGLAVAMDLGEALVLEAADAVGGRARYAGGFLYMVGTEEQAALGVVDSPERAAESWEALTGEPATDATRAFLVATDGIRDRLAGMGLAFSLDRPAALDRGLREHLPTGGGAGLVRALAANLPAGVDVRLSTPVRGLVFVDGVAAGVRTDHGWIGADTVIVASGGFADRADLVALNTGWTAGAWRMGTPAGADGAALDWAEAAGLGTARLDAVGSYRDVIGIPGADGSALAFAPRGGGVTIPWVWVDSTGTRFVDESATWSLLLSGLADTRSNVWAVTTYESIVEALEPASVAYLVNGEGWRCADDVEALAVAIEVDPGALVATVASVVEIRERRSFDPLGRSFATFDADPGTPCAFRPGNVAAKTFGGLAVDGDGRVLDAHGEVVPGLWAVGEAAGMGVPGLGGAWGFDGSLSAVLWSGWRTAAALRAAP